MLSKESPEYAAAVAKRGEAEREYLRLETMDAFMGFHEAALELEELRETIPGCIAVPEVHRRIFESSDEADRAYYERHPHGGRPDIALARALERLGADTVRTRATFMFATLVARDGTREICSVECTSYSEDDDSMTALFRTEDGHRVAQIRVVLSTGAVFALTTQSFAWLYEAGAAIEYEGQLKKMYWPLKTIGTPEQQALLTIGGKGIVMTGRETAEDLRAYLDRLLRKSERSKSERCVVVSEQFGGKAYIVYVIAPDLPTTFHRLVAAAGSSGCDAGFGVRLCAPGDPALAPRACSCAIL
jgi:hypothetical protein